MRARSADTLSAGAAYTPALSGGVARTYASRLSDRYDPINFGAVGDGSSHLLSSRFGTLGAAQVVYPHATSLNNQIDWAAAQLAINEAKAASLALSRAIRLAIPEGIFLIDQPLVLPRSGNGRFPVVQPVGEGRFASTIVGHTTFPSNRALIEFEAVTTTALHNRIANLGFRTPLGVAGVRAIWHKANKAGGMNAVGTTLADVMAEWFQCDMEDLYFEGDNQDNEVFIDLEVGNRFAKMWNLLADPWRGIPPAGQQPAYDTMLLRVAYQYAGVDPPQNEDSVGLYQVSLKDTQPEYLQGGWVRTFQGRTGGSTRWESSFGNGPNPGGTGIGFEFRNSYQTTLADIACEGGGGRAQYLFYNCRGIKGHNLGVPVGAPSQQVAWAANHVYALGDRVVPTLLITASALAPANRVYTVTTAGTSGGTEPAWNDTGTTVSGTVTFTASTGWGAADGIVLQSCEGCTFDTHYMDPGSPVPSLRRTKAVSIDANSRNNKFEKWHLRGLVTGGANTVNTDILSEVQVLGAANSISGDLLQFSGSWRLPFLVGLAADRLDAVTNYRGDDNLLEDPAKLDTGSWTRTALNTVTADATNDYLGLPRAEKIIENGATAQHSITQAYARGAVQKQQTFSIYLKAAERTTASLYLTDNTGFLKLDCNLVTGVVTASVLVAETGMTLDGSGSVNAGNGWWRFRITGTFPATTSATRVEIFPNTNNTYAGDNASGVYAFGAQLENAATAGPFREPNPTLYAGVDAPVLRMDAAMRLNRTVSFSTTGAYNGAWFEIVQTNGGAFTRNVGGLKVIPVSTNAKVRVTFDGSAWQLTDYAADQDAAIAGKAPLVHTQTLSTITDAGTAAAVNTGTTSGTIGVLGAGGKYPASMIPPAAGSSKTWVVADQTAMLALSSAAVGDYAIQTGSTPANQQYYLNALPASTLSNWVGPISGNPVTSVNTFTGAVTLGTSNIGETGGVLYYTPGRVAVDAPNLTLGTAATAVFSLTGQALEYKTVTAHYVMAGPTSGGAALPAPRLLVDTDLPSHTQDESTITSGTGGLVTDLAGKVNVGDYTNFDARYYQKFQIDARTLDNLADVIINSPATGNVVRYNGTTWVNGTVGAADIGAGTVTGTEFGYLAGVTSSIQTQFTGKVPTTRLVNTTAPMTGGGDLSADRTIAISAATSGAAGSMSAADKAKLDRVGTVVAAGTITTNYTPDAAAGDEFDITLGAATVTINAPTNAVNGRRVMYRFRQDGTGNRAVALNAIFRFGTDIVSYTPSTAINKTDYVQTVYNSADTKWDVVAIIKGL